MVYYFRDVKETIYGNMNFFTSNVRLSYFFYMSHHTS